MELSHDLLVLEVTNSN